MQSIRRYKRIFLRELFGVKDATHGVFLGYLSNINVNGLQVHSTKNLKPQSSLQLVLELPCKIYKSGFMKLNADLVWAYSDNVPGFYDLGFKLGTLSARDKKIIYELIAHYGVGEVIQLSGHSPQPNSGLSRAISSGFR